ncbi:MAG TPA: hypothetical protein VIX86_06720 [Streptosporangiaceae bacterium]
MPEEARNALVERAAELADRPWDAALRLPGDDTRFRETTYGAGNGLLGFYVDEDAQFVRIFDIVWIG